jgi:mono/diheme cytochrome c family protein
MTFEARFTFAMVSVAAAAVLVPARAPAAGTPVSGREFYMANNCYLCHGTVGQGGAGPRIAPPDLPPADGFAAYVRHPTGQMPAFTTTVLNDTDLTAIYGFLRSLPQPSGLPDLLSPP